MTPPRAAWLIRALPAIVAIPALLACSPAGLSGARSGGLDARLDGVPKPVWSAEFGSAADPDVPASGFVGVVVDLVDGRAIPGAVVTARESSVTSDADGGSQNDGGRPDGSAGVARAVTDQAGIYRLDAPPGEYDLRVEAVGYQAGTAVRRSIGGSDPSDAGASVVAGGARMDVALPPLLVDAADMRAAVDNLRAGAMLGAEGVPDDSAPTDVPRYPADVVSSAIAPPAPETVRVLMPDGSIAAMATDEYLKGVVPAEMGFIFQRSFEALRAQAIASRTYAAVSCLRDTAGDPERCEPELDANVDTTTRTQVWRPVHYDVSDAAVDSTRGQLAVVEEMAVPTLFFARTWDRTLDSELSPCCGGRWVTHLRAAFSPDPFAARWGHGAGMSQEGAAVLADWGATAEEILTHYYSGVRVEPAVRAPEAESDKSSDAGPPPVRSGSVELEPGQLSPAPVTDLDPVSGFGSPGFSWREGPVVETDFRFMAVAARWRLDGEGTDLRLLVRASDDGRDWSTWHPLAPEDGDGRFPSPAGEGWTRLMILRGRYLQLRAGEPTGAPEHARLKGVALHYLNSDAGPAAPEPATVGLRRGIPGRGGTPLGAKPPRESVPAPNTALEASPDAAVAPVAAALEIVPRSGWGADEALRFADGEEIWPPDYTVPRAQIVHHTVTANAPADPAAVIRAIYHYQAVTRGWGDIGYNYLVDHRGVVYEGRYGGVRDGRISQGGHALQFNTNTIGVALLGTFTESDERPEDSSIEGLVEVLATRGVAFGIEPGAPVSLAGTGFPRSVMGHRDVLPGHTACPGLGLHGQLETVRTRVAARMAELRDGAEPPPTATALPVPTITATQPRPTVTPIAPSPSPSATPDSLPTAPSGADCRELLVDGGFESPGSEWILNRGYYTGWDVLSGSRSLFVGLRDADPDDAPTYASASQMVTLPERIAHAELRFGAKTAGFDSDRRLVRILDATGALIALAGVDLPASSPWTVHRHGLGDALEPHAGSSIRVYFGVINDGDGLRSYSRLDDVSLTVCEGSPRSPSSAPSATPSPSATITWAPTATPTSTAEAAPPSDRCSTLIDDPSAEVAAAGVGEALDYVGADGVGVGVGVGTGGEGLGERSEGSRASGVIESMPPGWRSSGDHPAVRVSLTDGGQAWRLGPDGSGETGFGYAAVAARAAPISGFESARLSFRASTEAWSEGGAFIVELRDPERGSRLRLHHGGAPGGGDPGVWEEREISLDPSVFAGGAEVFLAVLNRGLVDAAQTRVVVADVRLRACRPEASWSRWLPRLLRGIVRAPDG